MKMFKGVDKWLMAGALALASSVAYPAVMLPAGVAILEDDNAEYAISTYTQDDFDQGVINDVQQIGTDYVKTSGALKVGDRLRAIVTFEKVQRSDGSTYQDLGEGIQELTGISEIQIASINFATGSFTFTPSASFEATYGAGAMAALYQENPGDLAIGCGSIVVCESRATNGSLWMVAGIQDDDDYWVSVGTGPAAIDVGLVGSAAATVKAATANYALTIMQNNTGYTFEQQACPGAGFVPGSNCGNDDGMVDLIGSGDILGGAGLASPFFARSDFDFQLVRVPEPASLALMALGLLALRLFRRRSENGQELFA